jgi:hypothetical protein
MKKSGSATALSLPLMTVTPSTWDVVVLSLVTVAEQFSRQTMGGQAGKSYP